MAALGACSAMVHAADENRSLGSIAKESWGKTSDGESVDLYTLTNTQGMTMRVTNYGAIVVALTAPDRDGKFADVVLGYDHLDDYLKSSPYFGAVVGRYGNRIAAGRFTLDGKTYQLATNNAPGGVPCHLHGGNKGFDKVVWDAKGEMKDGAVGIRFHRVSPDGEEGYPGNLDITMHYWLTDQNEFRIEYAATTDRATPVNVTHHSYYNLGGHDSGTILDHELMIAADHITPVDKGLIPTGAFTPVAGTPFDFTSPTVIGSRVNADDTQLEYGLGYDHNFVLSRWDGKLRLAATVYDPQSGRQMEVLTTEPAIQFYCGNFLDGSNVGKGGHAYAYRTAIVLETQHYPDSPNHPDFPSTILRPGEEYRHTCVYRFSAR
ncbi:MAG TPA: aldose epimerase family protein [Phycisphaerae bacterium]|nr:aldose epimerase family protein [Phycisphaerae bacterium]